MSKTITLIHPDIDPGLGRTRALIEELALTWKEGSCEGGGEIAAAVALLASEELVPHVAYVPHPEGPLAALAQAFAGFLMEGTRSPSDLLVAFLRGRGWQALPLFVGGVANATGALYALLSAAKAAGGEVITASLNYVGVVNAIVLAGATPRFVDVDPATWCMDPTSVEKAITKKTRGIVLTHLNRLVDLAPYVELFKRRGLDIPLIQDASLAVGSTCDGLRPGLVNIGPHSATVMSLATSKVISGLGGAVVAANDRETLDTVVSIAYQGMSLTEAGVLAAHGANIKMNDLNAAIALEQLKRREMIFERRRWLKGCYDAALAPLVAKGSVVLQDVGEEAVVTHYGVLLPDRERIAKALFERHRIPLGMWHVHHLQALYRGSAKSLPVCESLARRLAFLPFHTKLADSDVASICRALALCL
jgi:dTDP-4-amino-4,6-dideoxygalactose transaminase